MDLTSLNGATVLLDLDGTLVDTAPDLAEALNAVLAARGLGPAPFDEVRHLTGFGARRLIERGLAHARKEPFSDQEMERALAEFIDHYSANIAVKSAPFPGAVEALTRLSDAGAKLAICTNKRESLARLLLDQLGLTERFCAIVGGDTLPVRKPEAAPLIEAARLCGGHIERSVMVGDSRTDVNAARAAGAPVVVVSFGYSDAPPKDLGGDTLVDTFDDVPTACADLLTQID